MENSYEWDQPVGLNAIDETRNKRQTNYVA